MADASRVAVGLEPGRVTLLALVPGLLLVDMLNGLVEAAGAAAGLPSPGEVVRGGILVAALIVTARVVAPSLRKLQFWIVAFLALGAIGPLRAYTGSGSVHDLAADVAALSKAVYGPAMILLVAVVIRRYRLGYRDVADCIAWVGAVAAVSILLLTAAGLGASTYHYQQVGSKGLFIAQNDIGLAMGLSLIASTDLAIRLRSRRHFALAALTVSGMLLLGTRAAMLGAFLIPVVMFVLHRPRRALTWREGVIAGSVALLVVGAFAAFGTWEYRQIRSERFQQERLQRLASNPFVRGLVVAGAVRYVMHRPLAADLVGEGMSSYSRGVATTMHFTAPQTMAEVDWMDLFGEYGAPFALLAYAFYIAGFMRARRRHGVIGIGASRTIQLAAAWFLAHSMIAGHAMAGTIPAGTLAPFLALVWAASPSSDTSGRVMAGGRTGS